MGMDFDFERYIADFNGNDDESMVPKHYTEDVVVEGPDRTLHGRQEWLDTLKFVHRGVRERLQLLLVLREGDALMAELNAVFTASVDRPDFPFGPLPAGQSVTVRFFASYRLRGHQISRLALGFWMPGKPAV
jgi:SnoaL-like domain